MIPSVLLPAVHQDPSTPYLDSTPVASTSAVPYTPDEQTIHCSQCNRDLPRSNFPTRLINLQPYQVCRAHEWYWTEAKRAQNWAPEHTSTLQQICDAFEEVARDDGEFEDRFMVNGEERDVDRMVQALARAGNWKLKSMTPRASRAKVSANDPPPPPTWLYAFREQTDPKKVNRFRLTIWFHRKEGKFTMTLKREVKKDRSERPWARPERTKGKAIQRIEGEPGEAERSIPPPPPPDAVRRQSPNVERSQSELSRAQQDAQQMPPPPIPPRKKARRVEPSLVSVPLPRPPASFTSSSTSTTLSASSNQLLPQTDMAFPDALAQLQQSFSNDGASLTLPTPPPSYSSSSNNPFTTNPTSTSTPSSQSTTMLTLFEMLNMPAFDPPIIPLPPRNPRPASTTTNNNDHHNNNNNNNNSKRLSNQRQHPQEAQKAPAKAGKELEDAVADILGTRRRTTRSRTRSQEADEEEDLELSGGEEEEEDEGDYEDSIPDDSSEEGDEEERNEEGRGEEDDDDGSSFFESSAEEYSEQGSGGEEEEEEEEGGVDWFTGFITKQMPGMVNAGDNEEDDEEEEVHEAQSGRTLNASRQSQKEKQNQPDTTSGTPSSSRRKRGRSGSLTGEEDEVDELESSSEE